jgi:hypothetical protein
MPLPVSLLCIAAPTGTLNNKLHWHPPSQVTSAHIWIYGGLRNMPATNLGALLLLLHTGSCLAMETSRMRWR